MKKQKKSFMRYKKSPAILLHEKFKGKLAVKSKIKIKDKKDLSLIYTPGVASVSDMIYRQPDKLYSLTNKKNTVAVLSNGSAVLGLGDIGPEASLPVMEGKAVLFKEFANIDAWPIVIKAKSAQEIINFALALAPSFGGINLEDIAAPICFEVEEILKKKLDIPVMHDDQHGTAIVVLAGLINSLKVRGSDCLDIKIVINGAGAAGSAIANLLYEFGFKNILVLDSQGILSSSRKSMSKYKKKLAHLTNRTRLTGDLVTAVTDADVLIGVSKGGLFKKSLLQKMNKKPIIFALANPVPEIMPQEAYEAGAFIVATGRSDFPNQLNNVLAFPGVFRGALDNDIKKITQNMKIKGAINLANLIKRPRRDKIIPSIFDKRVASEIARAIC